MISRIIKVEVGVISRSRRLRSQKPNPIIVLLDIKRKKMEVMFCFFTDGKQRKARELDMITRDLDMITV